MIIKKSVNVEITFDNDEVKVIQYVFDQYTNHLINTGQDNDEKSAAIFNLEGKICRQTLGNDL